MKRTLEELLDSVSMNSVEAEGFHDYIRRHQFHKAENMLLDYMDKEEVKTVMLHFKNRNKKQMELHEIDLTDPNVILNGDDKYLISVGGKVTNAFLFKGQFVMQNDHEPIEREKVNQCWIIREKAEKSCTITKNKL